MNRFLLISIFAIFLLLPSCSDDNKDDVGFPEKIIKTSWERDETLAKQNSKVHTYARVEFHDETFSLNFRETETFSDNSVLDTNHAINGKYKYNFPSIILTYYDEYSEREESIEFSVFENYIANNFYGTLLRK